ncbi:MAG: SRPBCC domain-containing protein [Methanocella sp.]
MTSTSKKPAATKLKPEVPLIEKDIVIKAPVEKVWAALTDQKTIGAWMDDDSVKVNLKVGGKYALFGGVTTGKITAIEKPSLLEYTWRQGEWEKSDPDTLVRWELKPEGKKTRLRLVHSQFADRQNRDDHDEGWDVYFLGPMKEWLEDKK